MLDAFIAEPAHVYHAKAKEYMSSHRLTAIRTGAEYDSGDKPVYRVGRWTHQFVLEGPQAFFQDCVVGGPFNPKTGLPYGVTTNTYESHAEVVKAACGRELVPPDVYDFLRRSREAVTSHPAASQLLEQGAPELVARVSYEGVKCQIRCDWLTPECHLVDLKTCRSLEQFQIDALRYGYLHQLAFYREVLRLTAGHCNECYLIALEKAVGVPDLPRVQVLRVSQSLLDEAQEENEKTLREIAQDRSSPYVG